MFDLLEDLRRYGDAVEAEMGPNVRLPGIHGLSEDRRDQHRSRRQHRRLLVAACLIVVVGVVAAVVLLGRDRGPEATVFVGSPTTSAPDEDTGLPVQEVTTTIDASTSTVPALPAGVPRCLGITPEIVSDAIGATAHEIPESRPPSSAPDSAVTCRFEGEGWHISVSAVPRDPDIERGVDLYILQRFRDSDPPTLDGIDSKHVGLVDNGRSGNFGGELTIVLDDTIAWVFVSNSNRGADTYPDTTGPLQKPVTRSALTEIAGALQG